MEQNEMPPIGDNRQLAHHLNAMMSVRAPETLIPSVFERLGLSGAPVASSTPVAVLVNALHDGDTAARAAAARQLCSLGKSAPIEPLVEALHDEQRFVRATAARALGRLGKRAPVKPLVAALQDQDGSVRVAAAEALGMLEARAPLEPLVLALHDRWAPVREASLLSLGKLGKRTPIDLVVEALKDDDKFVRIAALNVLGTCGSRTPLEPVVVALGDLHKRVREAAIRTLASQGKRVPIEPLEVALNNRKWDPMREAAVKVLSILGKRAPIKLLELAARDEWPPVREAAEEALRMRNPFVVSTPAAAVLLEKEGTWKIFAGILPFLNSLKLMPQKVASKAFSPARSSISRGNSWQAALNERLNLNLPDWIKQDKVALIVACIIVFLWFLFSQKSRFSSSIANEILNTPIAENPGSLADQGSNI